MELHTVRPVGINGPHPITWQELDVFNRLKQLAILPQEVTLLRCIEEIYSSHCLANARKTEAVKSAED